MAFKVVYYLPEKPKGQISLDFFDASGQLIKSYKSNAQRYAPDLSRQRHRKIRRV